MSAPIGSPAASWWETWTRKAPRTPRSDSALSRPTRWCCRSWRKWRTACSNWVGCRTAILPGKATSDVSTAVSGYLSAFSLSSATTTVKVNGTVADASTANRTDVITVTVSIPVSSPN